MISRSISKNPQQDAPDWLKKVYAAREQRTTDLVKFSVDALVKEKQQVSLSAIVAKSKEIDPQGKGVSLSAIQRNEEANTYYKQHRSHKTSHHKRSSKPSTAQVDTRLIKLDRDVNRARQRYLKLSKEELVGRLLAVEQALAEKENNWHQANDELLTQLLEAEQEDPQDIKPYSASEELQDLTDKLKRLRAKNKDLKAQLLGIASLEAENEDLKKQNQHLFNRITQLESDERFQAKKSFALARKQALEQPDIPSVEF